MKNKLTVTVERQDAGFVAYPAGLKGLIVGLGDTQLKAIEDLRSAVKFHVATFGADSLDFEKEDLE